MLNILFALLIVALVLWLVNYLPLEPPIVRTIVNVLIVIIGLLWAFGYGGLHLNVK